MINITHLVTPIPEDKPTEQELFGPHWKRIGYEAESAGQTEAAR
jgi:sulfoacetaldehyde dehydrogenase